MATENCLFCNIQTNERTRIIAENELAYVIRDGFPVTDLHTLVIPKRHAEDYFSLSNKELIACDDLLRQVRQQIQSSDSTVDGFNIGGYSDLQKLILEEKQDDRKYLTEGEFNGR